MHNSVSSATSSQQFLTSYYTISLMGITTVALAVMIGMKWNYGLNTQSRVACCSTTALTGVTTALLLYKRIVNNKNELGAPSNSGADNLVEPTDEANQVVNLSPVLEEEANHDEEDLSQEVVEQQEEQPIIQNSALPNGLNTQVIELPLHIPDVVQEQPGNVRLPILPQIEVLNDQIVLNIPVPPLASKDVQEGQVNVGHVALTSHLEVDDNSQNGVTLQFPSPPLVGSEVVQGSGGNVTPPIVASTKVANGILPISVTEQKPTHLGRSIMGRLQKIATNAKIEFKNFLNNKDQAYDRTQETNNSPTQDINSSPTQDINNSPTQDTNNSPITQNEEVIGVWI